MTTYWFRPKRYGYGATPISWQGWVVTLGATLVIAAITIFLTRQTALDLGFWVAIAAEIGIIVALVAIYRRKTEGEWRWGWGDNE